MSAPDYAAVQALLDAAGITPDQVRHLDAVVTATARATNNDVPDAIATLTMAIGLFAGLTKDPAFAIAATIDGLARVRDAYAKPSRSVPS